MDDRTRIYSQRGFGMLAFRPDKGSVDGSFVPFLLEEIIRFSALELVVPDGSMASLFSGHLPSESERYLRVVDGASARKKCFALLWPVLHEVGAELRGNDRYFKRKIENITVDPVMTLLDGVEILIAGIDHRATIDLDVGPVLAASCTIRANLRDPEARQTLAQLEGLLAAYNPMSFPALVSTSHAPHGFRAEFQRLLEHRAYEELSISAAGIGVPEKIARAGQLMRMWMDRIISDVVFRNMFNIGSRSVTAISKIPTLDSNSIHDLLAVGYLPPIANLDSVFASASNTWRENDAEFIPVPGLSRGRPP